MIEPRFENDVKTYGTQAINNWKCWCSVFENDVKTYGTQAVSGNVLLEAEFENDVKTYGTQAKYRGQDSGSCLRMM